MLTVSEGVHRYETFGLHSSWLGAFLAEPIELFRDVGYLGPLQRLALGRYVQDAGIWNPQTRLSHIGTMLSELIGNPKWGDYAWPVVWTRLCITAPVFRWYGANSRTVWTLEELSQAMQSTWPEAAARTLYNARLELLGTLKNTPVGDAMGQGVRVLLNGSPALERKGPPHLSAYWALFCASTISAHGLQVAVSDGLGQNIVARLLGVSNSILAAAFESLWQPDLCRVSRDSPGVVRVELMPGITSEKVLERWIAAE